MQAQESAQVIQKFLLRIRFLWQNLFLVGVMAYGATFYYRLQMHTTAKPSTYLQVLNWISFIIALGLAISIFQLKRKYFRLGYYEKMIKDLFSQNTGLSESQLARQFTRLMEKKMRLGWLLAIALILVGVIYYWITFDAWNMHVYFIVGLYSLVINYPRKDLLNHVPYLIKEFYPKNGETK
ncbi:MAG: hypothetical protein A2Y94_07885 [Caldithrix sp. RBG_13_44_9]|nr:MAG: hypothetical protein A2Y94_07885 [Caldithrix sp. RBG_13_44_9]